MTTTQTTTPDTAARVGAPNGLTEHSHVGGRTASPLASHLHPVGSPEVAAHPVPTSKDELWRFTPLRRLRGLHADVPFGPSSLTCDASAPDGVQVRAVTGDEARALKGASGYLPTDRFTARIVAEVPDTLLVEVPAGQVVTEPVMVTLKGSDATVAEAGHILIRVGEQSRVDVVLQHQGSATAAHLADVEAVGIVDVEHEAVVIAEAAAEAGGVVQRREVDPERGDGGDARLEAVDGGAERRPVADALGEHVEAGDAFVDGEVAAAVVLHGHEVGDGGDGVGRHAVGGGEHRLFEHPLGDLAGGAAADRPDAGN